MDSKRKLASVRRIAKLEPIEGADKILKATVDGWQLVTAIDNNFKENDLVLYYEIDSFLPVQPEYEFLRKGCFKSTKNLGDGFRLKTIKLRGQVSQGLILPLTIIKTEQPLESFQEGDDLTDLLGIQKYEKPIPAHLSGKVRGNFPSFMKKTDQERAQNLKRDITDRLDDCFEVTIKLDGSSMTVYHKDGTSGVCSRNLDMLEDDTNTFWQVAKRKRLLDILAEARVEYGINLAVQGELMGPGVQGNREKLKSHNFYIFDIWNVDESRYLLPLEKAEMLRKLQLLSNKVGGETLDTVPFVGDVILKNFLKADDLIGSLLTRSEGPSLNEEITREGLVFKSFHEEFSFKIISNKFLLEEKD